MLEDKVAVVTGGASGIGLATVRRLAGEGAAVVVVDLNEEAGSQVAEEVGGRFVRADVGEADDWARVVDEAERELGGLDVAYLNAGVTTQNPDIAALTDDQYRRVMRANVDGVVFGVRATVPALERRGGGAIVVTASLAGIIAFAPDPIYTLSKHAVVGLVRSLAPQLEAKGIRINSVNPGIVDTPLLGPDAKDRLTAAGFPLIAPDEIAAAVVGCITGDATGQCFVCQPGRPPEPYDFREVPGPRGAAAGMRPSL